VVLTQGEGGYQTVTILPPESSSGEVSYVLIVQQPDGGEQAVISSDVLEGADGDVLPGKRIFRIFQNLYK
jgi:transcriptional repressor CTCF